LAVGSLFDAYVAGANLTATPTIRTTEASTFYDLCVHSHFRGCWT
jgi:hypothetical protein